MAEAPKKRAGRPRKSPIEKQGQFSIRLPLITKLALEIIARDRDLSLAQAVEYVVKQAADNYDLGAGHSAFEHAQDGFRYLLERMSAPIGNDGNVGVTALASIPEHMDVSSEAAKAMMFPKHLLTNEEQKFVRVVNDLRDYGVNALLDKDVEELFYTCRTAQTFAITDEEVVRIWLNRSSVAQKK